MLTNSNQFQPIPTNYSQFQPISQPIWPDLMPSALQTMSRWFKFNGPQLGKWSFEQVAGSIFPRWILSISSKILCNPSRILVTSRTKSWAKVGEKDRKKIINKKKKILRGSRDTSRVVMWQSWWISREMYFISDWIHRYRPPVFPPVLVWEKFFFSNFLFLIFFPILFPIFGRFLDDFKNGFGVIFQRFFGWLLDVFWVIFG